MTMVTVTMRATMRKNTTMNGGKETGTRELKKAARDGTMATRTRILMMKAMTKTMKKTKRMRTEMATMLIEPRINHLSS